MLSTFCSQVTVCSGNGNSFCTANICDVYFFMGTLLDVLSAQNNDIQSQITIAKNL